MPLKSKTISSDEENEEFGDEETGDGTPASKAGETEKKGTADGSDSSDNVSMRKKRGRKRKKSIVESSEENETDGPQENADDDEEDIISEASSFELPSDASEDDDDSEMDDSFTESESEEELSEDAQRGIFKLEKHGEKIKKTRGSTKRTRKKKSAEEIMEEENQFGVTKTRAQRRAATDKVRSRLEAKEKAKAAKREADGLPAEVEALPLVLFEGSDIAAAPVAQAPEGAKAYTIPGYVAKHLQSHQKE